MIQFSQLEKITKGKLLSLHQGVIIEQLVIDSRKAILAPSSVFFAIAGTRNDGHSFIETLYQQGLRNFVVEKKIHLHTDANVLLVDSTISALQNIVTEHRNSFSIPVIGITGSNGKTIVKEWLYQLLSNRFSIVKNPGSYNSQVGVPLSVWNMQPYHSLGVFEAGISQPEEMKKLASVIQPSLGVFTNIGSAHAEGFTSLAHKIDEKSKLFEKAGCVIYCKDHDAIDKKIREKGLPALSWGYSSSADIHVEKKESFYIRFKEKNLILSLPFTDLASIENCLHCVAVMLHFNFSEKEIQEGVLALKTIPMRLELKDGINQCQVIDDSYNNDLAGLQVSLDFLNNQQQKQKKTLILSDVLQSGMESKVWIQHIVTLLQRNHFDRFIGIGKALVNYQASFTGKTSFFETTDDFLTTFSEEDFGDEIILVKGARAFAFERIVQRLQRKVHGTVMEIDLGALVHNLNYFRSTLKPATKIMAMVKAFAYGSGSKEVANLLQYHAINYLGVAYADEGVELRKNNIQLPIMVMNPSPETFNALLTYQLEPEVYNLSILKKLIQHLAGRSCSIHVKFDTGMHRLGFTKKELPELIRLLKENKNLVVASIYSHLAAADEAQHDAYSTQQANEFILLADALTKEIGYKPLYHLLNSPGILRLPQFQFDMVRLGIGLYGIDPTTEKNKNLKPVATLKTVVSHVNELNSGETVGYGRHGKIVGKQRIATLAIGYADGYSRGFSRGVGEVLINGKTAKVIGNVCMDMTMVDVTNIDVKEGDEVIIFGADLPIEKVAEQIHTIAYEILTNTSERVKRVFVAESI